MTKDKYLKCIFSDHYEIMYQYYKENIKDSMHLFNKSEFSFAMQMYPLAQNALNVSINYYEKKFKLVRVLDKDGKLIAIK